MKKDKTNKSLNGFIEFDGGLLKFQIIFDYKGNYDSAYVNGELADDQTSLSEFLDFWGSIYYESLEDYKKGKLAR